jgi:ferredoxin
VTPVRIVVDQHRCISAGQCVLTEPTVFDQGEDDGIVRLLVEVVRDDLAEVVRTAAELCPSQSIRIEKVP